MTSIKIASLLLLLVLCHNLEAKVFKRCDLAKTLKSYGIPKNQLATWLCIAQHESNYNTAAHNTQSGDHGIFQINQGYWCSNTKKAGKECHSTCAKFRDSNIKDDVACIKKIYKEHTSIQGNGFKAWVTYKYCKGNVSKYMSGCKV